MNKVLLTGRLTRDPEMRNLASGKAVTQFSLATNEYRTNGQEKFEYQVNRRVYPRRFKRLVKITKTPDLAPQGRAPRVESPRAHRVRPNWPHEGDRLRGRRTTISPR